MLDYRVNTGRRLDYHYLVNATMLYENLRGFMLLRLIGTMQLLMLNGQGKGYRLKQSENMLRVDGMINMMNEINLHQLGGFKLSRYGLI